MKQQIFVPCSFVFFVISFYWSRQGNICILVCNYSWGYVIPMYISSTLQVVDSTLQHSFVECINISWFCGTEWRACSSLCTATLSIPCSGGRWMCDLHLSMRIARAVMSASAVQTNGVPWEVPQALCLLSGFCEQSVASSVNFLIKCQENSH